MGRKKHVSVVLTQDQKDRNLLHAIENFRHDEAQKLLNEGANHQVRDKTGATPLIIAAYWGRQDLVKLLLEHGADVDVEDDRGHSPWGDAIYRGHVEIVKILVHESNVDGLRNQQGQSPLMMAVTNCKLEIVKYLLEIGADIDAVDDKGNTALVYAGTKRLWSVAQMLMALSRLHTSEELKRYCLATEDCEPEEEEDELDYLSSFIINPPKYERGAWSNRNLFMW